MLLSHFLNIFQENIKSLDRRLGFGCSSVFQQDNGPNTHEMLYMFQSFPHRKIWAIEIIGILYTE